MKPSPSRGMTPQGSPNGYASGRVTLTVWLSDENVQSLRVGRSVTFSLREAGYRGWQEHRKVGVVFSHDPPDPASFAQFAQEGFVRVIWLNEALLASVASGERLEYPAGKEGVGVVVRRK